MLFQKESVYDILSKFNGNYIQSIDPLLLEQLDHKTKFFDKEGFELTLLESKYAVFNDIQRTDKGFGHRVVGTEWYDSVPAKNFFIDHSFVLFRPDFKGEARKQLESYKESCPQIVKLLNIKKKIGLDLAVEFIEGNFITEAFHIEEDFHTLDQAVERILQIQDHVSKINWDELAIKLKQFTPLISSLCSDDQSDIKARLFGFDRTYKTIKII